MRRFRVGVPSKHGHGYNHESSDAELSSSSSRVILQQDSDIAFLDGIERFYRLTCNLLVAYNQNVESVFAAVADPIRRGILESLRTRGPLSLTQIAEPLAITRQAVTKHLDVLQASGLIRIRRAGRWRLHSLQSEPLREVEEWLKPYAEEWDQRLMRLKRHLEERP